jgi:DNA-binding phage protein
MPDHTSLDRAFLQQRLEVVQAVLGMAERCHMAGISETTLKAALVAQRSPDVCLLADEEAEGLIERLRLRES